MSEYGLLWASDVTTTHSCCRNTSKSGETVIMESKEFDCFLCHVGLICYLCKKLRLWQKGNTPLEFKHSRK